ncbi:MAG: DUF3841 domain-containing protein [Selenomonadaceae bacterium]|nr:DUF3841 domain-containing protein [Selenomonadaceae bacterium]
MLLWTIQPEEAWRILRRDGVYRCNPDKATHLNEDIDFSSAYDWMAAQMKKHIGKRPEGVTYPIWAWHTYKWNHKKPDLRTNWFRGRYGIGAAYSGNSTAVPTKPAMSMTWWAL